MTALDHLRQNSGLPGPRGNLTLLYKFAASATPAEIQECLTFVVPDVHNSPEEFLAMCGILGYCVAGRATIRTTLDAVRVHASHASWRVREAVAMGIQELAVGRLPEVLEELEPWTAGSPLERRAVVAGLAEPKLLKVAPEVEQVLGVFERVTRPFATLSGKLTCEEKTLRQALGYAWSVVVAALPLQGKKAFETLALNPNPHLQWIVRENLEKNRLKVMDAAWVETMTR